LTVKSVSTTSDIRKHCRHCAKVAGPGPEGITFLGFVKLFALPTLFVLGTGVGYVVALVYVAPSITSACFSAVVALSYILSIIFSKQPHLIIKVRARKISKTRRDKSIIEQNSRKNT
jgi:hypothetical protein